MIGEQGVADGLRDVFTHLKFPMKFHLALGRMHVYVYGGGIDFQKEAANRESPFHQGCVATFDEGVIDSPVFDGPPIDEYELALARGA